MGSGGEARGRDAGMAAAGFRSPGRRAGCDQAVGMIANRLQSKKTGRTNELVNACLF